MRSNSIQDEPTKAHSPSAAKLTNLVIGESVRVNTKGKGIDGWTGPILALDSVAIRLQAHSYHMTWGCGWLPTTDITVVPWVTIESIEVLAATS
ncbi:MAG: hypothetical protein ACJ789_21230 [Thermomicrobiales bacterium]